MANKSNIYIDAQKAHKFRIIQICMWIAAFILVFFVCAKAAYIKDSNPSTTDFVAVVLALMGMMESPFSGYSWGPNFWPIYGVILMLGGFAVWCVYDHNLMNRHYKDGEQYGSAAFQTAQSIKLFNQRFNAPYGSTKAEGTSNTILSSHCFLGNDTRKTRMNLNILIEGAPGSGKSHNVVKPNLLQADGTTSYVITDPSGELLAQTGCFLEQQGYDIKVFNLEDMAHSYRYNPIAYVREDKDVLTLIKCFIENTDGGARGSDPFWEKAERNLYEAIIFYLKSNVPEEQRNFAKMLDLIRSAKQDPNRVETDLDIMFAEVSASNPHAICVKKYEIFKLAPAKTIQSILISAGTRLDPFDIEEVGNLTKADELDLKSIGDRPTALFIVVPQGDDTYQFIMNMLYTQMFDSLYYHAKHDLGEIKLPCDIKFVLDEFANTGVIVGFEKKLNTMRKYGMSCMIFIQSIGQLEDLYDKKTKSIIDACDTLVYLGGNDLKTMEDISKKAGLQTVRVRDRSSSKTGTRGTDGKSFKYAKRELLTPDEVRRLKPGHAIVIIKGQQPFYDPVYDPFTHPCARFLSTPDGQNVYEFDYCIATSKSTDELYDLQTRSIKQALAACAEDGRPEKDLAKKTFFTPQARAYSGAAGSPENYMMFGGVGITTFSSGYCVSNNIGGVRNYDDGRFVGTRTLDPRTKALDMTLGQQLQEEFIESVTR